MKAEFDKFASRYDVMHQQSIAFSNCDSSYFAQYKVEIAARCYREFCGAGEAVLDFGCGPIPLPEHAPWIEELLRVVKPSGSLLIFEHNSHNPLTRYAVSQCEYDGDAILLSARSMARRLTFGGWRVRRIRYHVFFPQLLHWLRRFEHLLGRIPIGGQYSVADTR